MAKEIESVRIIALKARNVKRLSAVEIHPPAGEPVVVIGGENAQGKTSVLDAIMYALAGGKSIPDDVVKHGEKKATIEIDLGELKVTRILGKGSRLEVKAADGEKLASPQQVLDKLAGKLTFDPLRFQKLSESTSGRREQAVILKDLIGLDFAEHDKKRQILYDKRTDHNRYLKRAETQLETMEFFPQAPKEAIKLTEVAEELQQAAQHNEEALRMSQELGRVETQIVKRQEEIVRLNKEVEELIAQKLQLKASVKTFKQIDTEALKTKLENAEVLNSHRQKNIQRHELNRQVSELQKQTEGITETIEELDGDKQKVLAEADMPVEGLSFSEDGVMVDDVPFHNCSSAEQLKLSVAMGIKMNPKLKVMLIRDGSLLDGNSLETLRDMANKAGHQIWLERVGKGEECTVIIEDGTVVE